MPNVESLRENLSPVCREPRPVIMETEDGNVFIHMGLRMPPTLPDRQDLMRSGRGWGGLHPGLPTGPPEAQPAFPSPWGHRGSRLVFKFTEICAPLLLPIHQRVWDSPGQKLIKCLLEGEGIRKQLCDRPWAGSPGGHTWPSASPLKANLPGSQRSSPLTQIAGKMMETIFFFF